MLMIFCANPLTNVYNFFGKNEPKFWIFAKHHQNMNKLMFRTFCKRKSSVYDQEKTSTAVFDFFCQKQWTKC